MELTKGERTVPAQLGHTPAAQLRPPQPAGVGRRRRQRRLVVSRRTGAPAVGQSRIELISQVHDLLEDPEAVVSQLRGPAVYVPQAIEKPLSVQVKGQSLATAQAGRMAHVHPLLGGPPGPELIHSASTCRAGSLLIGRQRLRSRSSRLAKSPPLIAILAPWV